MSLLSTMSLLFTHLVENDYPAFDREIKRDVEEIVDCYNKTIAMRDIELVKRFEQFVTRSTGQQFSLGALISKKIKQTIASLYPEAKPGDELTVELGEVELAITVTADGGFSQTIPQTMASFDLTREEVEANIFRQQLETIGTKPKANYLDRTRIFAHPLSEVRRHANGMTMLNSYATASMFINHGYLDPFEGGVTARRSIRKIIGAKLPAEIEQELFDRYLPTIYQVTNQIVEALNK